MRGRTDALEFFNKTFLLTISEDEKTICQLMDSFFINSRHHFATCRHAVAYVPDVKLIDFAENQLFKIMEKLETSSANIDFLSERKGFDDKYDRLVMWSQDFQGDKINGLSFILREDYTEPLLSPIVPSEYDYHKTLKDVSHCNDLTTEYVLTKLGLPKVLHDEFLKTNDLEIVDNKVPGRVIRKLKQTNAVEQFLVKYDGMEKTKMDILNGKDIVYSKFLEFFDISGKLYDWWRIRGVIETRGKQKANQYVLNKYCLYLLNFGKEALVKLHEKKVNGELIG